MKLARREDMLPSGRRDRREARRQQFLARASWPLMVAHRVITGDRSQFEDWRNRLERVIQTGRLARARSGRMERVIAYTPTWRRARRFGRAGSWLVLALTGWTTLAIGSFYSEFLQFGAWAWVLFVPPLLPGMLIARRAMEEAALGTMANAEGSNERLRGWASALRGVWNSFRAGFYGGFSLFFLQGLMSWFLTPAPTLGQELWWDAVLAAQYGLMLGSFTAPLGLVLGRHTVDVRSLPPAPSRDSSLLTE